MRSLGLLITISLILLTAPSARSASKEAKERAARKACLSGDYIKGVEILSDLFIDTKDATFIFNQARCFEQNNRCEEAVSRFREYLRKASGLSADDEADTQKHIADCQALMGQKSMSHVPQPEAAAAPQSSTPALPSHSPPVAPIAVAPPETSARIAVATTPPPAANPGSGLRIAGIAFGVLGMGAVGTAIYYYTQAKSYSDRVSGQIVPNSSDESAGKNAETMQWVFYSAGAAAVATGIVLYVLGRQAANADHTTVSMAPMLGPGLAGVYAHGDF